MIILGTVLFFGGIVLRIPVLWTLGGILITLGLVLGVLGATGHQVGHRQHWY